MLQGLKHFEMFWFCAFLLFETIFGETFFDFNNLSFCLHKKVHIMFCSHRVSLGIKSRCDVLFEPF